MANPILVQLSRGGIVESRHRGAIAVADARGALVASWGDVAAGVFPRSAVKPLQALPLVESGAAAGFGLGGEELALACASHGAEAVHVDKVAAWLARLGLDADALECGAHAPTNPDAAAALIRSGQAPCPLHNNCSGKHAGFLTVARHLGVPVAGYIQPDHPVQRLVSAAIADMTGAAHAPWGVDGCGIPTFALPLSGIATAMARMADPASLPPDRQSACRALVPAMLAHPRLVAARGRLCTRFMEAVPTIAIKGGAEGVYAAILPDKGLGVALKIDDGAGRAAEAAILRVLAKLGAITPEQETRLGNPVLRNAAGTVVGEMTAVF